MRALLLDKNKKKPKFSFSGHETFVCRYSWIKKAHDALEQNPSIFKEDSAMAILGVGKNMVYSMKNWMQAFQLVHESEDGLQLEEITSRLFKDSGWDPYLEDQATLWLLHWFLASNHEKATTFYYAFNYLNSIEFTKEQLTDELLKYSEENGVKVSRNTLVKDVDIFIRTYCQTKANKRGPIEDSLDCPLVELDLISESSLRGVYRFLRSDKLTLANEILLFAILDYWNKSCSEMSILSFEDLLYGNGSPGLIFKIDEDSFAYKLSKIEELTDGAIKFDETSTLRQIYKESEISKFDVLAKYYKKSLQSLEAGDIK